MSERKFITEEKLKQLQEAGSFLEIYEHNDDIELQVGPNINTVNVEETNLLYELGKLNKRRKQIIEKLCQKEK